MTQPKTDPDPQHTLEITPEGELVLPNGEQDAEKARVLAGESSEPTGTRSGAGSDDAATTGDRSDKQPPREPVVAAPASTEVASRTDTEPSTAASVAPYNPHSVSLADIAGIARTLAQTGYFDDARQASQAFAKIMAGQELGIGPFRAMKEVRIIDGSPTLSAGATAALIRGSGKYDYRELERSDERCVLEFWQGSERLGEVTWTMEDAKRAKLIHAKAPAWEKYPRRMLFARAITEGATTYCPDIFGGSVYTPEELGEEA